MVRHDDAPVPPLAALGVAVLAVSTSAILVRYSTAPATVKALYRVAFTVAMLAPVAAVRHRGTLRRLDRRAAVGAVAAGVALAVHFAAWFASLEYTSVAAGGYVLAGRSLRVRVALVPYVTVVYAACAVCLLGLAVAQGHPLGGYPAREWLLFLAMAVGPGLFGHTVVNWALAHLDSSVVSVSLLGEPVGAAVLALALLGEVPGVATLVGGTVVLGGIAVAVRGRAARVSGA